MEGFGFASFVASLVFMICMQAFFKNIHALQNHSTPFFISSPSTRILKVGVPWKHAVDEFVSIEKNGTNFTVGGFCVKVFEEAIKTLNYSVQYIPLKLSTNKSEFDYMIHQIALKNLDAVVGDLTITSKRSQEVLFAQPFFDSGLVAVVPLKDQVTISFGWAFTKPFTGEMWLLLAGFFISGGMVIYILERSNNRRFRGQPSKQFGSVLWFSFTTWFTNQDDIRTVMGRIVLVAWIFVIGILQSCYTANLSAILTAPRLEPTLNDISSVVASNLRIGYHSQSRVTDGFLKHYGVSKHRLVPLRKDEYYNALSRGHVGAIVDERPYMQSLVAKHCNRLAFAGQTFTIQNWGFAFDRMNYQLVRDISIRILDLSENGGLFRLQQQWLPYYDSDCSKYSDQSGTSQLQVQHFWGLFVMAALVSAIVLLVYTVQKKWNSSIVASPTPPPPEGSSSPTPPPPPEGSSGHGGGGFIRGADYGGRLEVMKKIQNLRRTKSFANAMPFVRI